MQIYSDIQFQLYHIPLESYKDKLSNKLHFVSIILDSLKVISEKLQVNQVVPYTGLGPEVPLPSGPYQRCAHPGEASPPVPRGGSLAGCIPGRTGGQGRYWPDFARGVAAMCYAVTPSPGHLVQAALPCMSEHCSG